MATQSTVCLAEHERSAVADIASQRKWSMSKTIAELVRESPTFVAKLAERSKVGRGNKHGR